MTGSTAALAQAVAQSETDTPTGVPTSVLNWLPDLGSGTCGLTVSRFPLSEADHDAPQQLNQRVSELYLLRALVSCCR